MASQTLTTQERERTAPQAVPEQGSMFSRSTTTAFLADLSPEASRALETLNPPTRSLVWIRCALDAFGPGTETMVLVSGPRQAPRGLAVLARHHGSDCYEPVGASEVYEPIMWPCTSEAALTELAAACAELPHPVVIPRVAADSPLVPALRAAYAGRGATLVNTVSGSLWLALDDDWVEPERVLSASNRRNLERRRRRAKELGEYRFEAMSPTPETLGPLLEDALRIEAASWKGDTGTALLHDAARRRFFLSLAEEAARTGALRMGFLRFGETIAAMHFGVESDGVFWALKLGYDASLAHLSPGRMVAMEAVRDAAQRGIQRFEMMGSPEPWKLELQPMLRPCVGVRVYPRTLRSAMTLASNIAGWGVRRIKRRLTVSEGERSPVGGSPKARDN